MKTFAALFSVWMVTIAPASADFYDGNRLKAAIDQTSSDEKLEKHSNLMEVLGYVEGVADAFNHVEHCMAEGVTAGQSLDVVRQYLDGHPELRHYGAARLVKAALAKSFPCTRR